jgi:hypothetical protein
MDSKPTGSPGTAADMFSKKEPSLHSVQSFGEGQIENDVEKSGNLHRTLTPRLIHVGDVSQKEGNLRTIELTVTSAQHRSFHLVQMLAVDYSLRQEKHWHKEVQEVCSSATSLFVLVYGPISKLLRK